MPKQRLQKIISAAGAMSRRKAEEAIAKGRVSLNGKVVTEMGLSADPTQDKVLLDGRELRVPAVKTTILFHKPRGVITTKDDPQGRTKIMDLLPKELNFLNPVGRLDYDSEGLLLLTNDGDLANFLTHPRFGVKKVYQVQVKGVFEEKTSQRLLSGIELEDGFGKFDHVKIEGTGKESSSLEVTVSEGRKRFVRRMLEVVGHPVVRLVRIQLGYLKLENLELGAFRVLSDKEIKSLLKSLGR